VDFLDGSSVDFLDGSSVDFLDGFSVDFSEVFLDGFSDGFSVDFSDGFSEDFSDGFSEDFSDGFSSTSGTEMLSFLSEFGFSVLNFRNSPTLTFASVSFPFPFELSDLALAAISTNLSSSFSMEEEVSCALFQRLNFCSPRYQTNMGIAKTEALMMAT